MSLEALDALLAVEARAGAFEGRLYGGGGYIVSSAMELDWQTTTSVKLGLEWGSPDNRRRLRILGVYLNGFVPFGQFFTTTRLSNVGVEVHLDF